MREKFPDEGPLILKYLDREGDLVTITDRQDLHIALREVVEHADRLQAQHGGPKLPHAIPPLRIHAVRAAKEVSSLSDRPCCQFLIATVLSSFFLQVTRNTLSGLLKAWLSVLKHRVYCWQQCWQP